MTWVWPGLIRQGWELSAEKQISAEVDFVVLRFCFSALAERLFIQKKSEKCDQTDRLVHRPTSPQDLRVQYALVNP